MERTLVVALKFVVRTNDDEVEVVVDAGDEIFFRDGLRLCGCGGGGSRVRFRGELDILEVELRIDGD